MSRIFGETRQLAFVVEDIDAAIKYWSAAVGIGPFFIKCKITFAEYYYRGKSRTSPTVTIALSNSGYLQIELIQQHDDLDRIYKEFLTSTHCGLQHVVRWLISKSENI